LEKVLSVASRARLRIKWEKAQFLKSKINFLGYTIENGTIAPTNEKIKAVVNFPILQSRQASQRYLGLTLYMRRFIKDYALTAKPLSDLFRMKSNKKDDRNLTLTEQGLLSFNLLKQLLVSAPVLKLFDPIATTEVHTDASKYGFEGDLMQRDSEDQQFHPVEFMSRKTNGCEEKYSSYELEVLAIVNALKKWGSFRGE